MALILDTCPNMARREPPNVEHVDIIALFVVITSDCTLKKQYLTAFLFFLFSNADVAGQAALAGRRFQVRIRGVAGGVAGGVGQPEARRLRPVAAQLRVRRLQSVVAQRTRRLRRQRRLTPAPPQVLPAFHAKQPFHFHQILLSFLLAE